MLFNDKNITNTHLHIKVGNAVFDKVTIFKIL